MSAILDNIGLANMTEEQLKALVALTVQEEQRLEFKVDLAIAKDSEKRDLCKDISALANTRGGWILVGVEEGPNSEAVGIPGIQAPDKLQETIEQIVTSGIMPRIQHFDLRVLGLENGNQVLLVKIERDGDLHQVGYGDNRFYKRVHRTTVVMDGADMKGFFSGGHTIQTRADDIASLRSEFERRAPSLLERDQGVMTLFLAPETPPPKLAIFEEQRDVASKLSPIYSSGWDYRTHQASITAFTLGDGGKPRSTVELFDVGVIQAAECLALRPRGDELFVPSVAFERELIRSTYKYLHLLGTLGVVPPIWIGVALLSIRDYTMYVSREKFFFLDDDEDHACKQENIHATLISATSVESFETLENVAQLLKATFDEIWRAFNFTRSLNYDAEGVWKPA